MKKNDILILLIPSFLIVMFWVGFNIYHNYITSTIPEELSIQITPISPDFDTKTIENIKKRNSVEPFYGATPSAQTENNNVSAQVQEEIPISTPSGEQATGGGVLLP